MTAISQDRSPRPVQSRAQFAQQFRGHAVIDLNVLSPELALALEQEGVDRAALQALAGVDGQIKGKEFEKLFGLLNDGFDPDTSDKKLHLRDPHGDLNAAGRLNQAFLEEVQVNRDFAQYDQPGRRSAPAQERLTADGNARVVPLEERLPEVGLAVKEKSQRAYAEEHGLNPKTACRATAQGGIEAFLKRTQKKPHRFAPHDQAIQVGYAEDKKGRVAVDEEQARLARDYIDRCLDAGYPVMVGVSHTDYKRNRGNADQLTDHWVTISGRGYDDQGRLFYEFKDPGDGGSSRFYVDAATGKLFREGNPKGRRWAHRDFEVTQVRTYRGIA